MTTFSAENVGFPATPANSDISPTYYYPFTTAGVPLLLNDLPQHHWPEAPYAAQQHEAVIDTRSVEPIFAYSMPPHHQAVMSTTPNLNNDSVYATTSIAPPPPQQPFLNKDLMQQNVGSTWFTEPASNTTPLFDETLQDCMNMLSSRVTARPEDLYSAANNNIVVAPSLSEPLIAMGVTKNEPRPTERKRIKSMSAVFEQQQQWNNDIPTPTVDWHLVEEDPEALPRLQKPRYKQDEYNPKWVRYSGHLKEGYCDTCGRWLQLKNSAYWYHKQFYHGISSVSGQRFLEPLQQRLSDEGVIEGLCHQCGYFVPICNGKRQKNSLLWYKHAHKCHVYNKPEKYTTAPMPTSSHHHFPL